MNLYLVKNSDDRPVWIALESDQKRLYTFVQNTGKFHPNAGLYKDFYFEHKMIYEALDEAAAEEAILSGLGLLDERTLSHVLGRFQRDPDAISPEAVFGHALNPTGNERRAH